MVRRRVRRKVPRTKRSAELRFLGGVGSTGLSGVEVGGWYGGGCSVSSSSTGVGGVMIVSGIDVLSKSDVGGLDSSLGLLVTPGVVARMHCARTQATTAKKMTGRTMTPAKPLWKKSAASRPVWR